MWDKVDFEAQDSLQSLPLKLIVRFLLTKLHPKVLRYVLQTNKKSLVSVVATRGLSPYLLSHMRAPEPIS